MIRFRINAALDRFLKEVILHLLWSLKQAVDFARAENVEYYNSPQILDGERQIY